MTKEQAVNAYRVLVEQWLHQHGLKGTIKIVPRKKEKAG